MESHYLDVRTLNFIVILFSCICSISLLCYQYTQKKIQGLSTFSVSLLFIGLGPFLLGFRDSAPDWVTIIVANTLILIGFLLTLYSVSIFRSFPLKLAHTMACFIPLISSSFYYFTFYVPSVKSRIIYLSVYLCLVTLCCGIAMLKGKKKDLNLPVKTMAYFFFCYSAFMGARALWSIFAPEIASFMNAGLIHQLTFLFSICLIVALSFNILWLINARLVTSINDLSLRDALTGLYNRRALEDIVPCLLNDANKHNLPVTIVMADIDRFKAINDQFGHTAGDQVMERIATLLKKYLPESACVVRVGGDEFMLILLDKLDQAKYFSEQIRTAIENDASLQSFEFKITMSFGASELEQGSSMERALTQADVALYHSKHSGRNQVTLFGQHSEIPDNQPIQTLTSTFSLSQ
ncbi:GGDEF domain-containing protein [Vibrio natriegens]|uniref:GGDEF domain-containing protein n=1 Tax=Vibrio natriegens TaxID=691 RepID=UPI001592BDC9|nr:GGDEF domain-containing protein [Vibrio natriegens]NVC94434.1 GGDEF domain-containing protein [Vibrio natriegens]